MVTWPFSLNQQLPHDIPSSADQYSERPKPAPTADLLTDRLVAWNDSPVVVVCLPQQALPSIEHGAPQFQSITTVATSQSVDALAASLDTIDATVEHRAGPAACYYSVRKRSIRLSSNTFDRFFTDLQAIDDIAADINALTPETSTKTAGDTTAGACVWPTTHGVIYCKFRRFDPADGLSVHYGLLRYGIPVDMTRIQRLFESISDDPPTRLTPWPLRQLTLVGRRTTTVPDLEPLEAHLLHPTPLRASPTVAAIPSMASGRVRSVWTRSDRNRPSTTLCKQSVHSDTGHLVCLMRTRTRSNRSVRSIRPPTDCVLWLLPSSERDR